MIQLCGIHGCRDMGSPKQELKQILDGIGHILSRKNLADGKKDDKILQDVQFMLNEIEDIINQGGNTIQINTLGMPLFQSLKSKVPAELRNAIVQRCQDLGDKELVSLFLELATYISPREFERPPVERSYSTMTGEQSAMDFADEIKTRMQSVQAMLAKV